MDINLTGLTAIITGGSKGLGFAMAQRFAASGAEVAIVGRGREALDAALDAINATGERRIIGVQADVGSAVGIQTIYDETMRAFGKVDIVVNNAGTSRNARFETLTDDLLQHDLDQKLFAAVRLIRVTLPQMIARRWGRIINVLNIGAKAPRPGSMPTSISRAAGMALTKALAGECAAANVLVNALLVGIIDSDQHVQSAKRAGPPLADYLRPREAEIPLGRVGRAEEFANLACFLASDAASYVTGTAINVDGGRSPVV